MAQKAKEAVAENEEEEKEENEEQDEETKKAEGFIRGIVKDELAKGLTEFFGELPKQQDAPKGSGAKRNPILSVIFGDNE